ncbi:hypothetical protein TIFTF001_025398 [Ficus carica]|uniref:Uncharacterized protein n=1 Tax=Ficus carica TaxID=3494 RepID=A0AA88DE53_FICCA|nr:hypothetical protein TIFTF001_025398 [Ficus carica]
MSSRGGGVGADGVEEAGGPRSANFGGRGSELEREREEGLAQPRSGAWVA